MHAPSIYISSRIPPKGSDYWGNRRRGRAGSNELRSTPITNLKFVHHPPTGAAVREGTVTAPRDPGTLLKFYFSRPPAFK